MTPSKKNPEERPIGALLAPDILALLDESPALIPAETDELHPADLADVAEAMPFDRIPLFLAAMPQDRAAAVLEYLDEELRAEVLEAMSPEQAAGLVSAMTPETITAPASVKANSRNSAPVRPPRNPIGAYTAASVMVIEITGPTISRAPCIAAATGGLPSSRCR